MNGNAVSRQNGDGTAAGRAERLTRQAPGSDGKRTPYKTARRGATANGRVAAESPKLWVPPAAAHAAAPFLLSPVRSCTSI
ncbi:hypothetical protein BVIET440_100193 [Burkholderia vietnamiensis]